MYSSYISDSVVHILLDHVYSDLHHHLLDHQHEELLQQVHHCEVHHLCLFVDHQPVIIKVEEMMLHICYLIDKINVWIWENFIIMLCTTIKHGSYVNALYYFFKN